MLFSLTHWSLSSVSYFVHRSHQARSAGYARGRFTRFTITYRIKPFISLSALRRFSALGRRCLAVHSQSSCHRSAATHRATPRVLSSYQLDTCCPASYSTPDAQAHRIACVHAKGQREFQTRVVTRKNFQFVRTAVNSGPLFIASTESQRIKTRGTVQNSGWFRTSSGTSTMGVHFPRDPCVPSIKSLDRPSGIARNRHTNRVAPRDSKQAEFTKNVGDPGLADL